MAHRCPSDERGSSIDPIVIMQRVADEACSLVPGADGALVGLVRGDHLVYVCGSGYLTEHLDTRTALSASIGGLAVRSGVVQRSDDTDDDPRVDQAASRRLGTRSTICVPLSRGSEIFGVLAVGSTRPTGFTDDDVDILTGMAELVAVAVGIAMDLRRRTKHVEGAPSAEHTQLAGRFLLSVLNPTQAATAAARRRVEEVLEQPEQLATVFQPIVDIASGRVVAVEALSRFNTPPPQRPPDTWFADAHRCGLGVDLELLAVRRALESAAELPPQLTVTVNVGPEAVINPRFHELLHATPQASLVLELTEHDFIEDYPTLVSCLRSLRRNGIRLAVDDTGSGYSGLSHILKLAPDFIKLDRELTTGIDIDPVRRALADSLVTFARETGSKIIAEGVETKDELDVLVRLQVHYAQGYYLGRPADPCTLSGRVPTLA